MKAASIIVTSPLPQSRQLQSSQLVWRLHQIRHILSSNSSPEYFQQSSCFRTLKSVGWRRRREPAPPTSAATRRPHSNNSINSNSGARFQPVDGSSPPTRLHHFPHFSQTLGPIMLILNSINRGVISIASIHQHIREPAYIQREIQYKTSTNS